MILRLLAGLLLLLVVGETVQGQIFRRRSSYDPNRTYSYAWHCGNPGCEMCNRANAEYARRNQAAQVRQALVPTYQPTERVPDVELALDSTPQAAVESMMQILQPGAGDVVYDLGCGDGRILIAAARRGARALGVEINADSAALAKANVRNAGYSNRIGVYEMDATKIRLDGATKITMYLYPPVMEKIARRFSDLPVGGQVISYLHEIPGVSFQRVFEHRGDKFYLWERKADPAPVLPAGPPILTGEAPWTLTLYTRPNCPPCEAAKRDIPKIEALGIRVRIERAPATYRSPSYWLRRGNSGGQVYEGLTGVSVFASAIR